jgi:TetR/AcrR family transcriptional regulator, transcriptional repressor for nem operon
MVQNVIVAPPSAAATYQLVGFWVNYDDRVATRDPMATRRLILETGQQEVYLRGFQSASLDSILRQAGVTKGAFFHHFPSKTEFGYCLVDEVLAAMIAAQWAGPLESAADPLETIAAEFERGAQILSRQRPILGCPLNNLAQEMNPLDAGFRSRTSAVFDGWRATFRAALDRGQASGVVHGEVDTADAAYALVAQIEGTLSMARNSGEPADLVTGARGLRRTLAAMRAG